MTDSPSTSGDDYVARLGLETRPVRYGIVELWPGEYQAFVGGQRLTLTRKEFELLHVLIAAAGHVVAKERLRAAVWGSSSPSPRDRSVDVFVAKLRAKLAEAAPDWVFIHTHMRVGYRFDPESAREA